MNIIIYLKYTVFYIILGPYLQKWRGWVVRNMNCCYFLYYNTFIYIFYIRTTGKGEGIGAGEVLGTRQASSVVDMVVDVAAVDMGGLQGEDFTLPPLFRRTPTDSYGTFFRTGLSKI